LKQDTKGLLSKLTDNYRQFEWLALLRLLKKLKLKSLRLFCKSSPSLAFPAREIAGLKLQAQKPNIELEVTANFLGLQGAATPLPLHFSECILQDDPEDSRINEFFDFFNHHAYLALSAIDQKYSYLTQSKPDYKDPLSQYLQALAGLPRVDHRTQKSLRYQLLPLLKFCVGGQLSKQGLCLFLKQRFQVRQVALQERVMQMIAIPAAQQNRLGYTQNLLGSSLMLGAKLYQSSLHFELHLHLKAVHDFLPESENFKALAALMAYTLPRPLAVSLVLHADTIDLPLLSKKSTMRLGYTSILNQVPAHVYCLKLALI